MKFNLIAAACGPDLGIGFKGQLPWRLKEEMKYFNRMTTGDGTSKNVVIMGRKTWISIPPKMRPLKNRFNVVLSSQENYNPQNDVPEGGNKDDVIGCKSLKDAVQIISAMKDVNQDVWVIGGSKVYEDSMHSDLCHRVYLTEIDNVFECDTFFPKIDFDKFVAVTDPNVAEGQQREGEVTYKFKVYEKT